MHPLRRRPTAVPVLIAGSVLSCGRTGLEVFDAPVTNSSTGALPEAVKDASFAPGMRSGANDDGAAANETGTPTSESDAGREAQPATPHPHVLASHASDS